MPQDPKVDIKRFIFRHLHPQVKMGTASDRYACWLGQIYTGERYQGHITQCPKVLGEHTFTEEVLPLDSVAEFFENFSVLVDFIFYRPLKEQNGKPTQTFQVLGLPAASAGWRHPYPQSFSNGHRTQAEAG